MSFLVELSRSAYPKNAFDDFKPMSNYSLANAKAMMWMSQLAYETANLDKIESIAQAWDLTARNVVSNDPITGFPPRSACVVTVGGRGASIVAFGGTDPLKIEDWVTDFTVGTLTEDGLHAGFQAAVENVWPSVRTTLRNRPPSETAVVFTGHSLGGALAIIAAERAIREDTAQVTCVYTFGSPRTGGVTFFDRYTARLGDVTYRLVHGTDIVATVPPPFNNRFLHVGRLIQCPTDGRFDLETKMLRRDQNEPNFAQEALRSGLADFRAFTSFRFIRSIGPRPLDRLAALLPRMVRDHVPASYFRALSISLA